MRESINQMFASIPIPCPAKELDVEGKVGIGVRGVDRGPWMGMGKDAVSEMI